MTCAEQVRNVYVRVQMWKAVYCYIISTNDHGNREVRTESAENNDVDDADVELIEVEEGKQRHII